MHSRINKPRVFLSHASADKPFIERIAADLRRCHIEYWLDKEQIRVGQSWLKVIFQDGLPTCDAVFAYLTEHAIRSKMVEKELDVASVQQLQEGGVALLPYVSDLNVRKQLRSDLQTLQCKEWNEENYSAVLPEVVAEIWHSYLERTVETATLQEKTRRLELEIEIKRLEDKFESSVFAPRENQEFEYLLKKLDRGIDVSFGIYEVNPNGASNTPIGSELCNVNLLRLLLDYIASGTTTYEPYLVASQLEHSLGKDMVVEDGRNVIRSPGEGINDDDSVVLQTELQTYGLIESKAGDRWHRFEIAEKMFRFKYWLDYNEFLPGSQFQRVVTLHPEPSDPAHDDGSKLDRATATAVEADRRISLARRRNTWRESGEGIGLANQAIVGLFENLERRVTSSNDTLTNIRLRFSSRTSDSCKITNEIVTLRLTWNCPTTNARDALLKAIVEADSSKNPDSNPRAPKPLYSLEFQPHPDKEFGLIWKRAGESHSENDTTVTLEEYFWTTLIGFIQRIEEGSLKLDQ